MSRIDLPQGTLDLLILRTLAPRGWIQARWGTSEKNRRARYYELAKAGRKQFDTEAGLWKQLTAAVNQVLGDA